MAKSKNMSLVAAICTYNRYDLLSLAVESLKRQNVEGCDFSILIVDNSPDAKRSASEAKKYQDIPNLVFHHEKTAGLSNARNVAASMSKADIISYIDDDAIASPDWARSIIAAFAEYPDVGIVGGPVLPMWEDPRPRWLTDKLSSYVSVVDWGGKRRITNEEEWFAGANISFKREVVLSAGGFDTSLGRIGSGASLLSNEETKLTEKIRGMGFKTVYAPDAPVDHLVERARLQQQWFRRRVVWQAISDYMAKGGRSNDEQQRGWDWVLEYMSGLSPRNRAFRGLFVPCDGPEEFEQQLSALYNFSFNMLAGFPVGAEA